jgi:beta-glucanase (GH16 family)
LENDYKEFLRVEKSEELAEFLKMEKQLNSAVFKKKKAEIEALQFKGSSESKQLEEFKKLEKSKRLKKYFALVDSSNLKRFNDLENSEKLNEYEDLLKYIKGKFKTEKKGKDFKNSEAYQKQKRYKSLSADSDIKFFFKFKRSGQYKNYLAVKDSSDLKRFNELKDITLSKEFLDRKAYLEDKKKWEKTDDFALQQKYLEMKKQSHLINYFKYKNSTDFDFFRNWEVAFEDDFSSSVLQTEKWSVSSYWAEKTLGSNFSLPGDLQVFTEGNNLKMNGKLAIEVRKEKLTGKMWKMPAGFIPVEYDYSSGIVSTGKSFWIEDGIIEAKIKFHPVKEIVSSFFLIGEKNTPRVTLLEMGVKNRLGISGVNSNGKAEWEGMDISNLRKGQSYIFTLAKAGNTFTWKINETEVLKIEKPELNTSLHLNASSLVVFDVASSNLPAHFEIDWVKCYRKR